MNLSYAQEACGTLGDLLDKVTHFAQTLSKLGDMMSEFMNISGKKFYRLRQRLVPLHQPIQSFVNAHVALPPSGSIRSEKFSRGARLSN
jgi:hypothetical protein